MPHVITSQLSRTYHLSGGQGRGKGANRKSGDLGRIFVRFGQVMSGWRARKKK
jgi:hypothetical protein